MADMFYQLFSDEAFRHWFYWTIIPVTIFGGIPFARRIYNFRTPKK